MIFVKPIVLHFTSFDFLWKYQLTANCELTLFFLKQNVFIVNNLKCEKGCLRVSAPGNGSENLA